MTPALRSAVLLGIAGVLGSGPVTAQQTRNQRIAAAQQAYQAFETSRALDLLRATVNPAEGPQDSAWAYGVELLGQILSESGDTAQANVWFRWAFRLMPGTGVDTVNFIPDVVRAMRAAKTSTAPSPGDIVSRTRWEWGVGAPPGQGRLQVLAPRASVPVTTLLRGIGVVQSGQTIAAPAGTYNMEAAAEGYLPTQVTREVLPGVVTVVEFDLTPVAAGVLASNIRTAVYRQLIPLTVRRFPTDSTCAAGALVGGSGLVLTSYAAIRGAERISATVGTQRYGEEIRVLSWNVARDVAVLQLPLTRSDSLPLAAQATPGQFVWGLGFPNCQTAQDTRTRVGITIQPVLELVDSVRDAQRTGPLISSEGAVVGMLTGARKAAVLSDIRAVLDSARRQVAARDKLTAAQLSLRNSHAYGAVALSADATGVTAKVTPLETWQWAELAWSGSLPHTFTGPMGRYQLEVTIPGQATRRLQFTVRAGQSERFPVTATQVAGGPGPQVPAAKKKGGFPLPIVLIGAGGAGAAAIFLLKGGGPPTVNGGPGSIKVSFPNPVP